MFTIFFLFALVFSGSHVAVQGYCVADLGAAQTTTGYPCKPTKSVKIEDFSTTLQPQNTNFSKAFNISLSPAFVGQIPGLNGLGFAAAKLDLFAGGIVPLHSHPDASEMLLVTDGKITAGFISPDNTVFVKTITKGDVMVLPQGLLHFQLNSGEGSATAFLAFSSPNPSAQFVDVALFASALNSAFVTKTTYISPAEVKRLKGVFGGPG
uniref:Germin-like protein n=1 Tax=Arachis hypogaea TaxID=3818 RepID=D4NXQ3_ARAHY|nr:germin-like protein subfamily 3 member 1 precursor [Arachis hypogaea]